MNLATVAEFLQYTELHHIRVTVEGDKLVLETDALPAIPEQVLDAARKIKPQLLATLSAAPIHGPQTFVYRVRIDGKVATTYSDEEPDDFLQTLIDRFGPDRQIWISEFWPISH
jgi:hypothetical protein